MSAERVKAIKARWQADKKISAHDVTWLIERAEKADTLTAADSLRRKSSALADIFGGFR